MATKKQNTIAPETLAAYDKIIKSINGIERKGDSMPYTSVNGHMFSFIAPDSTLTLRLPKEAREAFMLQHKTKLAEAHGAVLKEYVVVPAAVQTDTRLMKKYFLASYEYVSKLKPKTTAPKSAATVKKKVTTVKISNINSEVDAFIKKKNSPLTAEIQRVREIILQTSNKIEENIKWSAPTFVYKGNIASFFMNSKKHVSLMFHNGAAIPDKKGLLEGDGPVGRVAKFMDMNDIEKKKAALQSLIKEWIKLQDAK